MEKPRTAVQKVVKMKELGIFDKWVSNADKRPKDFENTNPIKPELNYAQRSYMLLSKYAYLSDMIEASFVFLECPEGQQFWFNIVDELRSEI
ncbi:hypothetical protein ACMSDU_22430 [Bacteroides thetaiotaomicron]|uniref:hypothetical protein n=1 Tax=Bacteroides thetaiotaomicron TaxID=818 RepID=UPI0039C48E1E